MKTRRRVFLMLLAAAVPISLGMALTADALLLRDVEARLLERLRSDLRLLVTLWQEPVAWEAGLDSRADSLARALGVRVTLLDAEGRLRGDSALDLGALAAAESHAARPEILDAARSGIGEARRFSTTTSERTLYLAAAVDRGGRRLGYVRLAVPERDLRARGSAYHAPLLLMFGSGLAVFAAVGYFAARRLARPLEQVAALAEQSPAATASAAVHGAATQEARRLAASIRHMRESLLASLAEATSERERLQSILAGMREGILAVSPDQHVLLSNAALRDILRLPAAPAPGQPLASVVREPALLEAFERCCAHGAAGSETLTIGGISGRAYELRVQPFRPAGSTPSPPGPARSAGFVHAAVATAPAGWGAIGVFFDVTQLQALEKVRRDFIMNVSHELRTPLTAIRAFAETLLEGALEDPEHNREFLEIIRKHCERMQSLINDLTDLSLIETGAVSLELSDVELSAAVRDVLVTLRPKSEQLQVQVSAEVPEGLCVRADPQRLEQILINLADNAIKFNRPGGSVRLEATGLPRGVQIVVSDTGSGIPSDHLEKIFHRFHRVDPSRARERGGTGLGLAIVKHLVRLHGGSIRAESELGRGSRFILELPAAV